MRLLFSAAVLLFLATPCSSQEAHDQGGRPFSMDIGFSSVAVALEAMKAVDGVNMVQQEDWTFIEDERNGLVLWMFTRPGNPFHPSAVKRLVVENNGDVSIEMHVRCEAPDSACQELVRDFENRNAQLHASLVRRIEQRKLRMPQ